VQSQLYIITLVGPWYRLKVDEIQTMM